MSQDEKFMRAALKLAEKASASPNPCVGAVIVKEGKVIGKGFHRKAGLPHGEIEALNNLANPSDAKDTTLYVTL